MSETEKCRLEIANQRPNVHLISKRTLALHQPNTNPNKVQQKQMTGNHFTQRPDTTYRRCNSYSWGVIKSQASLQPFA